MTISGGYLHIPARISEQYLEDENAKASVVGTGKYLRICITNSPYDFVLDLPLKEWMLGDEKERKMYEHSIYIDRWEDKLATYENDGHVCIDVRLSAASVGEVDADELRKNGTGDELTYREAADLVKDYIYEKGDSWTRIKTKDVIDTMDIEHTHHNLVRVHDALEEQCEVIETGRFGTKVFKSPKAEEVNQ